MEAGDRLVEWHAIRACTLQSMPGSSIRAWSAHWTSPYTPSPQPGNNPPVCGITNAGVYEADGYTPSLHLNGLPRALLDMAQLQELTLQGAELRNATLPAALWRMPRLEEVRLQAGPTATGGLPQAWDACSMLRVLDLLLGPDMAGALLPTRAG